MRLKILSHRKKLKMHTAGEVFAVGGYPRSGTSMLSQLTSYLTDYYFDRNNVFPTSAGSILHTHWDPAILRKDKTLYIVRDPIGCYTSCYSYYIGRGWGQPSGNLLRERKLCKINWIEHVERANESGLHMVDYNKLLDLDPYTLERLANHVEAKPEWVKTVLELMADKHASKPHRTDVKFRQIKESLQSNGGPLSEDNLTKLLAEELDFYRNWQFELGS